MIGWVEIYEGKAQKDVEKLTLFFTTFMRSKPVLGKATKFLKNNCRATCSYALIKSISHYVLFYFKVVLFVERKKK